ncbi:hypothetical protein GCM10009431_16120 [Gaetbulibacter jejuensis]|uniref:Uncharacterized protein n=2 Tax=Gaetbulibacter jejuensis TaxID=584607 RepID=A0ABN1JN33_9FLAO
MYATSSNPKYTCKKCKRKIHVEDIEVIFKDQLTEFIISKEEVKRYFDRTHTIIREKEQDIENVKSEIQNLKTRLASFLNFTKRAN